MAATTKPVSNDYSIAKLRNLARVEFFVSLIILLLGIGFDNPPYMNGMWSYAEIWAPSLSIMSSLVGSLAPIQWKKQRIRALNCRFIMCILSFIGFIISISVSSISVSEFAMYTNSSEKAGQIFAPEFFTSDQTNDVQISTDDEAAQKDANEAFLHKLAVREFALAITILVGAVINRMHFFITRNLRFDFNSWSF